MPVQAMVVSDELNGRRLARPVIAADGRVLLTAGTALRREYVSRLLELGIRHVYVQDPLIPDIEIDDAISQKTRRQTTHLVAEAGAAFAGGDPEAISVARLAQMVDQIIGEIHGDEHLATSIVGLRAYDQDTYVHSVNVCVLCLLLGQALGLSRRRLARLGIGALLHDLGKLAIPQAILQKAGRLTPQEREHVTLHPENGYRFLRQVPGMSILAAHVAYQHHERLDGSGYPRGLTGKSMHEFGRIAAVADVYEALISDRPYRPAYRPVAAARILRAEAPERLDETIVRLLLQRMALYPNGTLVRLDDSTLAVVTRQTDDPACPVVTLVADGQNRPVEQTRLDLREAPRAVHRILTQYPRGLLEKIQTVQS